jgi:riboflavin kinase/FMN adenylyltransferase
MLVIDWPQFLENGLLARAGAPEKNLASVTIGVFDGVHRGHQALIERIVSHNADYAPAVITFRQNHKQEENAPDIQTFEQKLAMFEKLGIKITLAVDFTESFRRMAGIEFLEILSKRGGIGFLAVGNNFRCGYRLDTDAAAIQKFFAEKNIPVEIVPEVMEGALPVSSSRIRSAITSGDLLLAEKMLGRPLSN